MLAIRAPKDFWAGALYLAIGGAAVVIARSYSFGSGPRMGPGYFPTVLGGLLMLLGLVALTRSLLRDGDAVGGIAWRPLVLVTLGTVVFGVLLRPAGLALALAALLGILFFASRQSRMDLTTFATFAGLVLFCVAVFIYGLGVPMPLFGTWFGY